MKKTIEILCNVMSNGLPEEIPISSVNFEDDTITILVSGDDVKDEEETLKKLLDEAEIQVECQRCNSSLALDWHVSTGRDHPILNLQVEPCQYCMDGELDNAELNVICSCGEYVDVQHISVHNSSMEIVLYRCRCHEDAVSERDEAEEERDRVKAVNVAMLSMIEACGEEIKKLEAALVAFNCDTVEHIKDREFFIESNAKLEAENASLRKELAEYKIDAQRMEIFRNSMKGLFSMMAEYSSPETKPKA